VDTDSILVQQAGKAGIVKVIGRGSFKNARLVKAFSEQIDSLGIEEIVYDMKDCSHMDSTFMGVMAGLAVEQRKRNNIKMRLIHLTDRNFELLNTLGLTHFLDVQTSATDLHGQKMIPLGMDVKPESKREISEVMLEAHENLLAANPENAAQFQDVVSFLRERLGVVVA